jgi:hypothetical protein
MIRDIVRNQGVLHTEIVGEPVTCGKCRSIQRKRK